MCSGRTDEVGQRMVITQEVAQKIWDLKGHVPWGTIGPYAINLDGGEAPKALHRPTNTLALLDEDLGVQNGGWDLTTLGVILNVSLRRGQAESTGCLISF